MPSMKKVVFPLVAAAWAFSVACAFAGSNIGQSPKYMPPETQARAVVKWVRPICVETNRYIGWPSVCRLKNGDILAVFSGQRNAHICPYGKVEMVRSADGGETWRPVRASDGRSIQAQLGRIMRLEICGQEHGGCAGHCRQAFPIRIPCTGDGNNRLVKPVAS